MLASNQISREDGTYRMVAILDSEGRPGVILEKVFDTSRHVANVSVTFPMKDPAKAVEFVTKATPADWERGIRTITPLLQDAERIQALLTKFNRSAPDKNQVFSNLHTRKRYKQWQQ